MLLNKFLTIIWHENHFSALQAIENVNFSSKIDENSRYFEHIFSTFFVHQFSILVPGRGEKEFSCQIIIENVFRNFQVPLGYIIKKYKPTLEAVDDKI